MVSNMNNLWFTIILNLLLLSGYSQNCKLTYVGTTGFIDGGFSCSTMTDNEIDNKLDDSCNSVYSGSRNIRGTEIENGKYENILNLPSSPKWPFAPSCDNGLGCGDTCDNGIGRLCAYIESPLTWDTSNWGSTHGGSVLVGECVIEDCGTTSEPTSDGCLSYAGTTGSIEGGFSCSTMTDSEIDGKLDNACNTLFSGSRNIRGVDIDNENYKNIINLPENPIHVFVPSCPGCGNTCDNGNGRLCSFSVDSSWNTNDGTWSHGHGGAVLRGECVYDSCQPTAQPTIEIVPEPTIAPSNCLTYVGNTGYIDGGFSCVTMTDDEIDIKLDNACNALFSGSRNLRGLELEDGKHKKILNLPDKPTWPFAPSCTNGLGCGNTCDKSTGRLCAIDSKTTWNINDGNWSSHSGSVLLGECVTDSCQTTVEPTSDGCLEYAGTTGSIAGGFSCSTMTDDEIDNKLDNACNSLFSGSRNIRGIEIDDGNYKNIIDLPENPIHVFVPSCPGCGNTCDNGNGRLCSFSVDSSWNTSDGTWASGHGGAVLRGECIYDYCQPTMEPTLEITPEPTVTPNKCLTYVGTTGSISGGFDCNLMTDDFVDNKLDNACNNLYSGSRNIRGTEIENGKYKNILNLPSSPTFPFAPSCNNGLGCGDTCDNGNGRLCAYQESPLTWNTSNWGRSHPRSVLVAECVIDNCDNICLTYVGTTGHIDGGFSCSTMTDDEIDLKLDNACNSLFSGSRNLRGIELENGKHKSIINLPNKPHWPFAPSCNNGLGCGNTCDNSNGRLCAINSRVTWNINDGNWTLGHGSAVLVGECVLEIC